MNSFDVFVIKGFTVVIFCKFVTSTQFFLFCKSQTENLIARMSSFTNLIRIKNY